MDRAKNWLGPRLRKPKLYLVCCTSTLKEQLNCEINNSNQKYLAQSKTCSSVHLTIEEVWKIKQIQAKSFTNENTSK